MCMQIPDDTFGEILRNRRQVLKLKLSDVSTLAGIDETYLSKVERNVKPPPTDVKVRRLAKVLNVKVNDWLVLAHWDQLPWDLKERLIGLSVDSACRCAWLRRIGITPEHLGDLGPEERAMLQTWFESLTRLLAERRALTQQGQFALQQLSHRPSE